MRGRTYRSTWRGAPAAADRPRWPIPLLAMGLLAGVGGFVVLDPSDATRGGHRHHAGARRRADPRVHPRVSRGPGRAWCSWSGCPGSPTRRTRSSTGWSSAGVGGVMLRDENIEDEEQAAELVAGLRARLGEHLLVAIDDEGGRVTAMGALDQPVHSARTLARLGAEEAEEFGAEMGELARSIDVDWVFAPVVDLDDGPAQRRDRRPQLRCRPAVVSEVAGAFAEGLHAAGVAVTAKHFPGHGGSGDPHLGVAVDDSTLAELEADRPPPVRGADRRRRRGGDGRPRRVPGDLGRPARQPRAGGVRAPPRRRASTASPSPTRSGMGAVHARYGFDQAPAMAIGAGADAVLVNQGQRDRRPPPGSGGRRADRAARRGAARRGGRPDARPAGPAERGQRLPRVGLRQAGDRS